MRSSALAFLLLAPALRADGLADLRTALKNLPAIQAVKATVTCSIWDRSGEGKKAKVLQGHIQSWVEVAPSGMRMGWDKADLDRVETASKGKDKGPSRAMEALSAGKAKDLLNAAQDLLGDLKEAALQEDRMDTWQGKPARLLSLKLDAKGDMDEEDRKHLKTFSHVMTLWLAPNGAPLGLTEQLDIKGSFFLISFEAHSKTTRTFSQTGDRLVTVHEETESSGSGAGQQGQNKTVMDVHF